jgi:hypothetical protein
MGRYRKNKTEFSKIFNNDGFAEGLTNEKVYWYPTHFLASWIEAKTICDSYNMEFLSLDTKDEAFNFLRLYEQNIPVFTDYTHIGAAATIAKTLTDWFWVETSQRVNFTLRFGASQPDNYNGEELCLSLTYYSGSYGFNDIKCYESFWMKFICQEVVPLPPDEEPVEYGEIFFKEFQNQ